MIEKAIAYKNSDNEFIASLKKLGLSDKEIKFILKKYKRKKFEGGGDGGGGDGGGDGGSSGGDSGDSGGQSGAQSGDNTDGNNADGTSGGPGTDGMGGPGGFGDVGGFDGGMSSSESAAGAGFGTDAMGEFGDTGISSMGQTDTFASDVDENVTDVDMSPPALQTIQEKATALAMSQMTPAAMAGRALGMMTGIPGMGIFGGIIGSNIGRGVTAPDDFSQAQTSVQTSSFGSPGVGGGITTIPQYAPLTNISTGDNTTDSIRTRLENLLKVPPIAKIPTGEFTQVNNLQNVNPLSNYTLLDLYNLRK